MKQLTAALKYQSGQGNTDLTDSCYVSMTPTKSSVYRLISFLTGSGEKLLERSMLTSLYTNAHVTIMYSKDKTPDVKPKWLDNTHNFPLTATVIRFEEWCGHDSDGYLVGLMESIQLQRQHEKWKNLGCEHSYTEFEPHITVVSPYTAGMVDVKRLNSRLKSFPFGLEFVNETAVAVS